MGKWTFEGDLVWTGRVDHQIKIRGQRVEPAEIEQVLMKSSSNIIECLVAKGERNSEEFLIAYLALENNVSVDLNAIKKACSNELPQWKRPTFYLVLSGERLPRNANGKIDRSALPPPPLNSVEAPIDEVQTPLEMQVKRLWLEVLQRIPSEKLSNDASWTGLGGTSLSIIRLINLYRSHILPSSHRTLRFSDFLRIYTIREHAQLLSEILNDTIGEKRTVLCTTGAIKGIKRCIFLST